MKAVEKTPIMDTCTEAAKPSNSKSYANKEIEPVMFQPVANSTEASAESVPSVLAIAHQVALDQLTVAPVLPPAVAETVPSTLLDDRSTGNCPAPEQGVAKIEEMAPTSIEASVGETSVLPAHELPKVVEFTPFLVADGGYASSGSCPVPFRDPSATTDMRPYLVREDGASDFMAPTAQEAADCEISQGLLVACAEEERPAPNLLNFYGLRQQPFDVTPDPAYLYRSRGHREALGALSQGVENLRGFMALVAEPGMGKTTLLNKLMEELRDSARVAFLFQTQCSSSELLRYLLTELDVEHDGTDIVSMHKALSQVLFEEMLQGRRFVLIVDEAQNLQDSVLETIRLLSDYETTHSKLIQIVLAGQPQLVETLMRPGLVQLRQRIAVLANLEPLDATETAEYIEHRLRAAGSEDTPIFTPDAMALIAERSGGIPRSINNICFNAMLAGYLQRQVIIDSEIVRRVASKLDLELLVRRPPQEPVSTPPAAPAVSSELSHLAQLLSTALAVKTQPDTMPACHTKDEPNPSLSLTGRLTEKLTSQSWSDKNEFRIQVSLERDSFPGLPIAEHYYCRSFYVSEEQAKGLEPGKPVRVKFEQD
jgi:type II secretory pathway predicted ATPase ExeA